MSVEPHSIVRLTVFTIAAGTVIIFLPADRAVDVQCTVRCAPNVQFVLVSPVAASHNISARQLLFGSCRLLIA